MDIKNRLLTAAKHIPAIGTAVKMGMKQEIIEKMLLSAMDRADDMRKNNSAASGVTQLSGIRLLAAAFDQIQYAHGGFHEFYYETKKAMENQSVQRAMSMGHAFHSEAEWRRGNSDQPSIIGDFDFAKSSAKGMLTPDNKNAAAAFEAESFYEKSKNDIKTKNSTQKLFRAA
jgi:hypothetical protein